MPEKWSPFREGENHVNKYNHFFPHDSIEEAFDNPQLMEDWLEETCPGGYCYIWVYQNSCLTRTGAIIADRIIGVPKTAAIALKLMTEINPTHLDDYEIKYFVSGRQKYRVEEKFKGWIYPPNA